MGSQKGLFITLEGGEGVGKTTSLQFLSTYLQSKGIQLIATREPGGTEIAEAIRQMLLTPFDERLTSESELLLMFAARSQHLSQVIRPALEKGYWVICDRFTDASYAYQGYGRGIANEAIAFLESFVQKGLQPDRTLLLDAPVELALHRTRQRQSAPDRIEAEQQQFFERVRLGYLERARVSPGRYCIIDASQPLATVQQQLQQISDELLQWAFVK